jgi:MFS family permease
MHIWTALGAREAALLAVLLLLGAGPASLLPRRFDAGARVALAPILGFCLGTCVTTTLLEFASVQSTYWILVPLALASFGLAVWRALRGRWNARLSLRDVVQLLVVCVVVSAPLNYALHKHHSVGPVAYYYTDVDNYVGSQNAAQTTSLRDAREAWHRYERTGERFSDLSQFVFAFFADFESNLDATPLDANVNALLGLGATQTNSPFLVVLLLAGALGAFAVVRRVTGSAGWAAVLCGALFTGPFFLELWFDSFQAAIIGIGLILPAVVLGWEALGERRPVDLALFALVAATMLSVYPLFVPLLAAIGVLAIAWRAVAERRAGGSITAFGRSLALPAGAVIVATIAFNAVGFARDVGYYQKLLSKEVPVPRVGFKLPPDVLPGWLLQTREFWYMPSLGVGGFKQILLGAIVPAAFLAIAAVGLRRHPFMLALIALGALCGIAAAYAYSSQDACTYCAERYLLPLAPILAVLLALGLHVLLSLPSRWWQAIGIAGAVLVVAAVGQRGRVELNRFVDGSYFLDSANRSVLDHLPRDRGAVHVEGYGASVLAQSEQPLVYHLATERAHGRVSISLGSNVGNAIQYLTFDQVLPPGPEFRVDYRYVLTRLPGVQTDREVIARSGGIALQRRTRALEVTPYAGLGIQLARADPSGVPWVSFQSPMGFYVLSSRDRVPVWARLTFRANEPVTIPKQPGVRARLKGNVLTVCVRATGQPPIRNAALQLAGAPVPGAVQLTAMHAVAGSCSIR